MELVWPRDLERAKQNFFRALQLADRTQNLPEVRERDREAAARARFPAARRFARLGPVLVQTILDEGDVRLVARDDRQHIERLHRRREALGLTKAR